MRIRRYLFLSLIETFAGIMAVLYGVMLIVQWIQIGNILSMRDINLLFLAMVPMSVFVIPMGLLLSVLLVLEKLSAESEIIAMKACGVKSRHIYTPIIIFSIIATMSHGLISTYFGPISMKRIESQLLKDAPDRIISFLNEREFEDTFKGLIVYVESINPKDKELKNVFIETTGDERSVITSEKGTLKAAHGTITMNLKNGSLFMSSKLADRYVTFGEYIFSLDADLSSRINIKSFDTATQSEFRQLIKEKPSPKEIKEYHSRIAFPILNIILGLVGISFG
ncbi:MAG TPA: LptF/LptG family permease, partial [Desulfomonilia bacterium]|nr:LptF/LptG family permease [Desulfomonilia bacterium]